MLLCPRVELNPKCLTLMCPRSKIIKTLGLLSNVSHTACISKGRNAMQGKNVEEVLEDKGNGSVEGEWKRRMGERGEGKE